MNMNNLILTFNIHTFKCQVFWRFWNTIQFKCLLCGIVFLFGKKVVNLLGQYLIFMFSCIMTHYTKMTNKIQLCRIIYYFLAALHVLSNIFAHHQEHLNCITASGITHVAAGWYVVLELTSSVPTLPLYQRAAT
jgi:hypothetical protein